MFTKNKAVACANLPLSTVGLFSTAIVVNLKFPRVKLDKIQKRYQIYSSRIKTKETRSNPQKISDGSQNNQKISGDFEFILQRVPFPNSSKAAKCKVEKVKKITCLSSN